MKARFWLWVCDKFGHVKSGSRNAGFYQYGCFHYQCIRCRAVVTIGVPPPVPFGVADIEDA